jgi:hypothetical protein
MAETRRLLRLRLSAVAAVEKAQRREVAVVLAAAVEQTVQPKHGPVVVVRRGKVIAVVILPVCHVARVVAAAEPVELARTVLALAEPVELVYELSLAVLVRIMAVAAVAAVIASVAVLAETAVAEPGHSG